MNPSDLLKSQESLLSLFENTHITDDSSLLREAFFLVFDLIEEAEKGSCYTFHQGRFVPLCAQGYDMDLLKRLDLQVTGKKSNFLGIYDSGVDAWEEHVVRNPEDYTRDQMEIFSQLGTSDPFYALYASIKGTGNNLGIICLDNHSTGFHPDSRKILRIYAKLISNFYTRVIWQKRAANQYYEVVSALVSAIEVKDTYTRGHANRVMEYSTILAEALGVPPRERKELEVAALLHDVGKIGIPTAILTKAGKLTEEEFAVVRTHPQHAVTILENISGLEYVMEYVRVHHEYYTGKGYPTGIPNTNVWSGIITLADAFDAMTSNRSYRTALSREEALSILKSQRGIQFHPEVVDCALNLFASAALGI